jgi:very-short-patch-repair endonuclease
MRFTGAKIPWQPRRRHRSKAPAWKRQRAKELRHCPTLFETLVWNRLCQTKTTFRFRRQALCFGWILDLWVPSIGLCVELDGPTVHNLERDAHRDNELASLGVSTLRLANSEILQDIDGCVTAILRTAEGLKAAGTA